MGEGRVCAGGCAKGEDQSETDFTRKQLPRVLRDLDTKFDTTLTSLRKLNLPLLPKHIFHRKLKQAFDCFAKTLHCTPAYS